MQSYQYALAAGILWLATLTIVPILLLKVRRQAYETGIVDGKTLQDHALKLQLKGVRQDQEDLQALLDHTKQECQLKLAAREASIAALKANILELEARIMSYTGLAVTKADYEQLLSTADSLRLAQRTLSALKSQQQAARAGIQAAAIEDLAKRMHAQLRAVPASAPTVGAAA